MNGILPLWKPRGMTSHDCVMKIRRLYKTRKVGHTGTLDPEVEGVLPICIGQATKIVPFLTDTKKTYIAEVKLGQTTETEDSYGGIVEAVNVDVFPEIGEIDACLQSFLGVTKQIPPMYSAVKVNGKKLYEYARANEEVVRPVRNIEVHSIERIAQNENDHTIRFQVTCSKGTYIRTLCVDIGKQLGYPAHMSFLERIRTGNFTKQEAITFDQIEQASNDLERAAWLKPLLTGVDHLSALEVSEQVKHKVQYGQKLSRPDELPETNPFLMMHQGELLAIYQIHEKNEREIKPVRVFQFDKK
ncbi:tRNA pseudouridine(55) synthase TruB [Oceanobacillus alkalisoli]|uniref:tRNA pseudouridine(55) synthase TruB n=1 Tax=Oceanobacillus alkalisoli TaxID=2925113 RepID=UPI001EEFF61A|nr:tRNA pseudouridine(55) synthase TruB [Oceanobacillus alkalisoli]MCF3942390.1 tRNA pseudouridine(55) synthase TruB [Oceanobacillus alkalisoli]MCG5103447.1 tRNA pseudouridine(55) synthase TruB [Oceanobacillus alkalisoli]